MERHIGERFERIERNLETASQINQDTATLARENQKRLDQLMAKMDEFLEVQRKSVSNHRVAHSVVSTPIARKVGRRVENACVSYRHIENGRYDLVNENDGSIIGGAAKNDRSHYEANVGRERVNFRTLADVIAWASNLVYDGSV